MTKVEVDKNYEYLESIWKMIGVLTMNSTIISESNNETDTEKKFYESITKLTAFLCMECHEIYKKEGIIPKITTNKIFSEIDGDLKEFFELQDKYLSLRKEKNAPICLDA